MKKPVTRAIVCAVAAAVWLLICRPAEACPRHRWCCHPTPIIYQGEGSIVGFFHGPPSYATYDIGYGCPGYPYYSEYYNGYAPYYNGYGGRYTAPYGYGSAVSVGGVGVFHWHAGWQPVR